MRDGSDHEPNEYIQSLRQRPVERLNERERSELLTWLKSAGLDDEHQQYVNAIKALQPRTLLDPLSGEFDTSATSLGSTEGRGIGFDSESLNTGPGIANIDTGPMSMEALLAPDPRAVTLQPLLQLPPTQRHRLEDTMKVTADETRDDTMDGQSRVTQVKSGNESASVDSEKDASLNRGPTAEIRRNKAKPRVIERSDEAALPPSLPVTPPMTSTSDEQPQSAGSDASRHQTGIHAPNVTEMRVATMPAKRSTNAIPEPIKMPMPSPISHRQTALQTPVHGPMMTLRGVVWLTSILLGLLTIVLVLDYRAALEDQRVEAESFERLYKTGNHQALAIGVLNLEHPTPQTGFRRTLLNLLLPIFGMVSPDEMRFRMHIIAELKLRSSLGYFFDEYHVHDSILRLSRIAKLMAIDPTHALAAQILVALKHERADRVDLLMGELKKESVNAHLEWVRGLVAQSRGERELADAYLRSALTLDYEHPYAALSLATLLEARGDKVGASKMIDQILMVRPTFVLARLASARIGLESPERRNYARQELSAVWGNEAYAPAERGIAALLLGKEALKSKDYDKAEARFISALALCVRPDESVVELVNLYLALHRGGDAQRLLKKTNGLKAETKRTLWARLFLMSGQPRRALQEIKFLGLARADTARLSQAAHALTLLIAKANISAEDTSEIEAALRRELGEAPKLTAMSPPQLLIYGLLHPNDTRADAVAKTKLREANPSMASQLFDWATVLAELRLHRGDYDRAFRVLSRSVSAGGRTALVEWTQCRIELARRQVESGIAFCESALQKAQFRPARQFLAKIHELRSDFPKVVSLLSSWPTDQVADANDQFRLLRSLYQTGQNTILKTMGTELRRQDLSELSAFAIGLSDVLSNRSDDGVSRLRRVAQLKTVDARTLTLLGDIFSQTSRPREAQALYERAMKLSDEPYERLGLARLLLDHGQAKAAYKMARDALRKSKSSLSPPTIRASALAIQARSLMGRSGKRNLRKTTRLIEKSLRVKANNVDGSIAAALLKEKIQEPSAAKKIYRDLINRPNGSDEAHYRLGRLLMSARLTRREGVALLQALVDTGSDSRWTMRARRLLPVQRRR